MANDRVVISLQRTIPVEAYGNVEIKMEYSSDKPESKSASSVILEVETLVIREFERLAVNIEAGKIKIGGKPK